MLLDGLTILAAAVAATLYKKEIGAFAGLKSFWHGTLIPGATTWELLIILLGFMLALIETSRRMHLYTPLRVGGFLAEQRLTIQACSISGLLLTGSLYLVHAGAIPRSIVLLTLGLVMVSLCLRRLIYRAYMHRAFERGIGTRNILIVGTGPEAQAFRRQLTRLPHLGYSFKGFIEISPSGHTIEWTENPLWERLTHSLTTPESILWTRSLLRANANLAWFQRFVRKRAQRA